MGYHFLFLIAKIVVFTVCKLVISSYPILAQASTNETASMNSTANILWNLELEGVQDLVFDQIEAGSIKEIDIDGSVLGQEATGNEQIGIFRVQTKEAINFQFADLPTYMVNEQGFRLPITFLAAWGENRQGADVVRLDPSLPISIPADEEREYVYLFLGASVNPSEDQAEGDYAIELRISVVYGS